MKAATKVAIATLSSILLIGSSVSLVAKAHSYEKAQQAVVKKTAEAAKPITAEEKKFIEQEIERVKKLTQESGDMYVLYHKYPKLNSGFDISYWGGVHEFTAYEDYLKKATTLKGSILKQPANLPKGYKFLSAVIEGPIEGKFVDEVRAEGKESGKPIYVKKIDWKEAATIRLKYTNGKDTLGFSKYTVDSEENKKKGFFDDTLPAHIFPKYVFWNDGGKFEYNISTSSLDISRKQKIAMLKAAVKK
jgi:bla regulator protein BlaR1